MEVAMASAITELLATFERERPFEIEDGKLEGLWVEAADERLQILLDAPLVVRGLAPLAVCFLCCVQGLL